MHQKEKTLGLLAVGIDSVAYYYSRTFASDTNTIALILDTRTVQRRRLSVFYTLLQQRENMTHTLTTFLFRSIFKIVLELFSRR